ncbi:uncharacterized protein LOC143056965 [Mytilus galloprovincialis]|uniref:uncharacterized protein LOC143056965 n=1 Tax=Mytilus galloprovincialis TaxID=29158 RepID=UPI003F7BFA5A
MERDKRRTSISSKGNSRSTTTSNLNPNQFVRQSIDYSGVDSDALSEIIKHEDNANNDVINTSHHKEGLTSNKIKCTLNKKPNITDINKSTKDAYRRSILELPGAASNKSLSSPFINVSLSQTVSNCQHTLNSVQNKDISYKGSRPSIHHKTNKNKKSDKNVAIPETRGQDIISSKYETNESRKRRHRSRSHSTDSRRRKKIRLSTNCVGNSEHKQQSSRNDKYPDGKTTYSVGRGDKSPVSRFHGRDRRDTNFDRNIYRKSTQSPRSAAYRERSPLRQSHEQQKGHVSRRHAYHRSGIKRADLHLSSNQNYDLHREQNHTFDNRSRSNVDINTEYDRNIQRAHELERSHEDYWHGASSNSYDDLCHRQSPTFDRTPRLNDDFKSEYYRNSQRTHQKESYFENIWQGVSSDRNYDIYHEHNHIFDGRSRSNYDINMEYDNNALSSYEIESQHETPWHRVSSNRNYELSREQNPTLDRRSRLNSDINTEYDRNTKRPYEIESRHDNTRHTVIPNRNYEPYRGHTSSLDKRSRSNVDTEYDRNIKRTHENINRTISNKETYENRSNSKSNVVSTLQYTSERQHFRQNSHNRFQKIDLEKLSKMDTDSLAAHLSTYRKELDTYLFEDLGREQISLLLQVMCQLCECKRKLLVQKALTPLKERRFFDRQDIKNIICELRLQFDEEKIQILKNLLLLMKGLAYHVNTGPADLITPLDSLEVCVSEKLKDENQRKELKTLIQQIKDKWDPENNHCKENKLSTLDILPDLIEIESFASSSIDSEYETEESYLRRLFMVHRQDFIRPLCKGLMSLKNALFEDPCCLERKWRHDDIRVYKNIFFLSRCCNEQNGITWKIRFDTKPYIRINWNTRKLLTFGSLVCLTNREFTILQYATVADRNAGDLKNGLFQIKLVDDIGEGTEILKQPDVLLIESQAFFPSYFHTLKSLKSMHSEIVNAENSLPFGKQLFNKKHSVEQDMPDYFKSTSFVEGFDIRCLNSEQKAKVDISNEANWPDADNLCMDNSQHRAFTTSIKSKLALIQGPPGTGKTVVGLKLAELLLRNKHIWRQHDNQGPMLLLSYTNHALDQFLLDISKRLRITDAADIVRLGGRSEIEMLSKYNLAAKRKAYSYKQEEFVTRKGAVKTHTIRESSSELNVIAFNSRKKNENYT